MELADRMMPRGFYAMKGEIKRLSQQLSEATLHAREGARLLEKFGGDAQSVSAAQHVADDLSRAATSIPGRLGSPSRWDRWRSESGFDSSLAALNPDTGSLDGAIQQIELLVDKVGHLEHSLPSMKVHFQRVITEADALAAHGDESLRDMANNVSYLADRNIGRIERRRELLMDPYMVSFPDYGEVGEMAAEAKIMSVLANMRAIDKQAATPTTVTW
jgi:hypothetical protein